MGRAFSCRCAFVFLAKELRKETFALLSVVLRPSGHFKPFLDVVTFSNPRREAVSVYVVEVLVVVKVDTESFDLLDPSG